MIDELDASPNCETLKTFFWWVAKTSKGRINEKITPRTLSWKVGRFVCMYKRYYNVDIPDDTLDEVRRVSDSILKSGSLNLHLS